MACGAGVTGCTSKILSVQKKREVLEIAPLWEKILISVQSNFLSTLAASKKG